MNRLVIDFEFTTADPKDPMSGDNLNIVSIIANDVLVYPRASERLLSEFIYELRQEIRKQEH